jgi:pheromone shutdown protein TraB
VETRPYFVLGDIVSNVVAGALVGGACAALLPPGWNMVVAMSAGMALGMATSLPLAFLLSGLFGAMETLLPVMTTGMVAGMVIAMQSSLTPMRFEHTARIGGLCGLAVVIATYLVNAFIRPRATRWTT